MVPVNKLNMNSESRCLFDRCILIFFGLLLGTGGVVRLIATKELADYGTACLAIGLILIVIGVFVPCRIVNKLTSWF